MLSDDELAALRDIERRLRWHSPELVHLFDSQEPQPEPKHRQRARTRAREALTCQRITARARQRVPTTKARAELERK